MSGCYESERGDETPANMVERMWVYAGGNRSGGDRTVLEPDTRGQGYMGE